MLFHKVPFAANFSYPDAYDAKAGELRYGKRTFGASVTRFEGDVWHIELSGGGNWDEDLNLVPLLAPPKSESGMCSLKIGRLFDLQLLGPSGEVLLETDPRFGVGVCGPQSVFTFLYEKAMRFYGLGEKTFGKMDLSQIRARFWNVDALGDFHGAQWSEHPTDPYYVSVPYMIVQRGDVFVGLLLHNPFETWVDTGTDPSFFGTEDKNRKIVLGAEDGRPSLWILVGPTLAELTQKLQKLVGVTPRPPLWSLGYHQCRWEYEGEKHLSWLHENMVKHQIPNDGLWLDIDYMDGYRVFTYSDKAFPSGVKKTVAKFEALGRKVVPIIDPGVKLEPKFKMYEAGLKAGIYCENAEGRPFVGFVWPGETVFPDFSLPEARAWWAEYAADFKRLGFAGAWVDMNDPSTGAVDPYAMLFRRGTRPHGAFRNQYALGMQMATREGFQKAAPNERIFLLSRSGYTGTSRYSAIWTGDNVSNRFYLKGSIPTTLNLSLSGIPFNGPDIGGFISDCTEDLMVDWVKAGFLFPFFRNHSGGSHRRQEPWVFSKSALKVINHYTRLRYKLIPYLYQLFVRQELSGDPILAPAQYHFPGGEMADDTFLVGPSIFQAPVLEVGGTRTANLPGKGMWFDARWGEWVKGNQEIETGLIDTPLYFADNCIVPSLKGERKTSEKDLRDVEFHLFIRSGEAETEYVFDDGETLDYQSGVQSRVRVRATLRRGVLRVETEMLDSGYGELSEPQFVCYGEVTRAYLNGKRVAIRRGKITWTGHAMPVSVIH